MNSSMNNALSEYDRPFYWSQIMYTYEYMFIDYRNMALMIKIYEQLILHKFLQ